MGSIPSDVLCDLCAALQAAIADILADRIQNTLEQAKQAGVQHFVLAGGVAANQFIRTRLMAMLTTHGFDLVAPPVKLCTDNGVMIAWAGIENLHARQTSGLDTIARPRWPLDELKQKGIQHG
jgi:N6-L-threonylcarbamoyladenine synthase